MTLTEEDGPEPARDEDEPSAAGDRPKPSPVPRSRAVDETSETDSEPTNPEPEVRTAKGQRGATVLACLTVAVVLLTAAAVWFALEADRLRDGAPEENAAVVDADRTAEVRKQVSAAVESIFSYNYTSLSRTRRAAQRVLLDEQLRDYSQKLSKASKELKQKKLTRTTSVRALGVRELHDDTATVLIFLDQQTLVAGGGERRNSTTFLEVTAKKVGDSWKIAKMSGA